MLHHAYPQTTLVRPSDEQSGRTRAPDRQHERPQRASPFQCGEASHGSREFGSRSGEQPTDEQSDGTIERLRMHHSESIW